MLPANSNDTKRLAGQTIGRVKYGAKYEESVDLAEVAKRIRKDIAARVKDGTLPAAKYGVRISRYSQGQSLDVRISGLPFDIVNPARVRQDVFEPNAWPTLVRHTNLANCVLEDVRAIVDAYNFDGSDPQTDYYHTNFYGTVDFGGPQEDREWAILRSKYEAEKALELAPVRAANLAAHEAVTRRNLCPAAWTHDNGSGCSLCE